MDAALRSAIADADRPDWFRSGQSGRLFPASALDPRVRRAGAYSGSGCWMYPSGDYQQCRHYAAYVARTAPSAMIFIPCKDGISHNEIEDALPEHLIAGANVLLQAMLARRTLARRGSDAMTSADPGSTFRVR
jgi:N-carbamoyl-L-amino-acid hydrolase